jgi:Cd2+/Zn2+-exporting ATPase
MTLSYNITGLDCASCGIKIENAIKKLPGVQDAAVDFASMRLFLDAADPSIVLREIERIEPSVKIIAPQNGVVKATPSEASFDLKRELLFLLSALVLFVVHYAFEDSFHKHGLVVLEYGIAFAAYFLAGSNIYINALRTIRKGDFFDENVLMVIATTGAIAIHALSEAVSVMLFFKVGELLQNMAVDRSRRSIRSLLAAKPGKANVVVDAGILQLAPEQVNIGDTILIRPGEKVPLDGEVLSGNSSLDTSALTGEPVPVNARPGSTTMAGMINLTGSLRVRVSKPFSESSIAKVLHLVETAMAKKAKTEKFITSFARWYTPFVVAVSVSIAIGPPLLITGEDFRTWIYRALVVLVVSCPCALVISIPLGYFGGIGRASNRGILIKGSNFLDALSKVSTVVFDKTGTLTRGTFEVGDVVSWDGYQKDEMLKYAALAEMHSTHPIAKSIVQKAVEVGILLNSNAVSEHVNLPGRGIQAVANGRKVLIGSDGLLHDHGIAHDVCEFQGTSAHVVIDDVYAGYILIGDSVKKEAKQAITELRKIGVKKIVMLTGDNRFAAESVAKSLGIDSFQSELLPEDKVRCLEELQADSNGGKLAFVGDGINDAPVIARADVGVAMGALGSDAAIETADVVLMTDSPLKIVEAIQIARRTRMIVWQNIFMAISIKMIFVTLGTMGMASMWEAVFADMGVSLAAVVNSARILRK